MNHVSLNFHSNVSSFTIVGENHSHYHSTIGPGGNLLMRGDTSTIQYVRRQINYKYDSDRSSTSLTQILRWSSKLVITLHIVPLPLLNVVMFFKQNTNMLKLSWGPSLTLFMTIKGEIVKLLCLPLKTAGPPIGCSLKRYFKNWSFRRFTYANLVTTFPFSRHVDLSP